MNCNITANLANVAFKDGVTRMKENNAKDFFGKVEGRTTNGAKVCDYTKSVGMGLVDPFVNLINLIRDVAALIVGAAKMFCSCKGDAWKDLGKRVSNVCVDGGKLLLTPLLYPLGILFPQIRNGVDALRFVAPAKVKEEKNEEADKKEDDKQAEANDSTTSAVDLAPAAEDAKANAEKTGTEG